MNLEFLSETPLAWKIASWSLTYFVHSSLTILVVALLCSSYFRLPMRWQNRLWRVALIGPLLTTAIYLAPGKSISAQRWELGEAKATEEVADATLAPTLTTARRSLDLRRASSSSDSRPRPEPHPKAHSSNFDSSFTRRATNRRGTLSPSILSRRFVASLPRLRPCSPVFAGAPAVLGAGSSHLSRPVLTRADRRRAGPRRAGALT